jgi:hypothetical protein
MGQTIGERAARQKDLEWGEDKDELAHAHSREFRGFHSGL